MGGVISIKVLEAKWKVDIPCREVLSVGMIVSVRPTDGVILMRSLQVTIISLIHQHWNTLSNFTSQHPNTDILCYLMISVLRKWPDFQAGQYERISYNPLREWRNTKTRTTSAELIYSRLIQRIIITWENLNENVMTSLLISGWNSVTLANIH